MKALKFMLAAATAIGLTTASQANVSDYPGATDFEGLALGVAATNDYFQFTGDVGDDESEIVSTVVIPDSSIRPREYRSRPAQSKHLKVSTGEKPLLRKLNENAQPADGLYIDTLVQFTVSTDDVTTNADDKLLIYLKEDGNGGTNLFVKAALVESDVDPQDPLIQIETIQARDLQVTTNNIAQGQWYRLTVMAKVVDTDLLVFNIWLNGDQLDAGMNLYGTDPKDFPSLLGRTNSTTLSAVGFAGEGAVDDLVFTTDDPFLTALDFTLTLGTGVTGVNFTIDGTEYTQSSTTGTYPVYVDSVISNVAPVYAENYMAGSGDPSILNLTQDGDGYTVAGVCSLTLADGVLVAAKIGDDKFADVASALAAATAGQTVTLQQDATVTSPSTAADTLDLNGKTLTLSGAKSITFTGTGDKTLKGGNIMGVYHELTNTVPAGSSLTLDSMTFHASVMPDGSGALLFVTNCQFLCDYDKTGAAFTDGSSADVHSYGLLFNSKTLFAQADVVDNYFDQGRRAAVQASMAGDFYFYGNTVVADKLTSRVDGAGTRYPALQIISNGRVFIENNTFSGQYLGEAFCVYNKGAYRTTDKAIVFSGNTVGNGVNYLWGIYDVDKTGSAALVNPDLYFGANTVDSGVDTTGCIYKTTLDGVDMNGVTYSHTPATLALPAGVDSVYAWTHAADATDLYVDGVAADAVAAGTVIAVPGATVTSDTCVLTADATLKNQWTAAAAAAKIVNGDLFATFKEAVDAAQAGDTVTTLADCAVPASVSFTKNITVSNDYTIAANVNYALCIGATVTFEGSGMIQRGSTISGSAFCVGANEKTRGAITVGTAGTLIFNGGTICGGNGGNQIKLENGTVEMNGGVLKDGLRGIKADADAGSYTSAIVINGGTITNCSAYAVMASAESATGTATLTVNGGNIFGNFLSSVSNGTATITIEGGNITGTLATETKSTGTGTATLTIPGNSTAKFDRDQSAFCASGYETTLADGWYVVTAVAPSGEELEPGEQSSTTYDSQAAAEAALANVTIAASDAVTNALNPAAQATYLANFEAKVVPAGEGQYKVEVGLTAAAETALQAEVNADAAEVVEDLDAGSVTLTTTPGFYYSFEYGTSLDNMTEGARTLATGDTLTLTRPTTPGATSGFYKVLVNVAPAAVTP